MATAAQVAQMDKAQGEVLRLMEAAEAWAAGVDLLPSLLQTDAQRAALKAIRDTRALVDRWTDGTPERAQGGKVKPDGWRYWAQRGRDNLGQEYSVSFWLERGKDFASALATYTSSLWDGSVFRVAVDGTAATVKDTAQLAMDVGAGLKDAAGKVAGPWSLRTKLAVGGAVGMVGLGLVAWLANSAKPLLQVAASAVGSGREE